MQLAGESSSSLSSCTTKSPYFNPSVKYDGKKGKKNATKRKFQENSTSKTVLKDAILLPSPKVHEVPRELLYSKDVAKSVLQISDDMTEFEIRSKFDELFEVTLGHTPGAVKYEIYCGPRKTQ